MSEIWDPKKEKRDCLRAIGLSILFPIIFLGVPILLFILVITFLTKILGG